MRCTLLVGLLAACAHGTNEAPSDADGGRDAPGGKDAAADAPVDGPPALMLTEVVLAPSTEEFIEIANPTDETVKLANYYLADTGTYFRLPAVPAVDVDQTDFLIKFPAGATLGAKATVTVALDTAANFSTRYGIAPSFSIVGGTMVKVASNGTAQLTNGGEVVVLFYWDGRSDLVQDVDVVLVGAPSAANGLIDKSGMAFDGPDPDTTTSKYRADARTMPAQPGAPGSGLSTKRILRETGHEAQTGGGNGVSGDDETTENTAVTWDTSFTAPTPGALPAGLLP